MVREVGAGPLQRYSGEGLGATWVYKSLWTHRFVHLSCREGRVPEPRAALGCLPSWGSSELEPGAATAERRAPKLWLLWHRCH